MAETNKWWRNKKWQRFFAIVRRRSANAEIPLSAAAISYYLLLSMFPLIIALGNVLPFLEINPETILPYFNALVPESIYQLLEGTIRSLLNNANSGLLSISALATAWAASRSINALQQGLNKAYGVDKRVNPLFTRLFSFGVIFLFLMTIILVGLVFTVGQLVIDYISPIFNLPTQVSGVFGTLKWPIAVVVLFVTMSIIYYVIPNAQVPLSSVLPGSIFTTVSWMLLTQFFGLYTKYFSNGFSSYGVIGSFIVFMLWLNFSAVLIMVGGLINAVVMEFHFGDIMTRSAQLTNMLRKRNQTTEKKQ